MPVRLCSAPKCPGTATYRGRCERHARERNRETHTPAGRKVYASKRWQMVRRDVLTRHPFCKCGELATDVDHVTPLQEGGAPFDPSNLQPLCKSCHSRKTRREVFGQ